VKFLEKNPALIPAYDQVLVDEFQDFNLLEVSLIELLAQRSPVLIAGDDDQALYDFKQATPAHIRRLHGDGSGYEKFNLPICSRCTRVIVDAANDIVSAARSNDLLSSRISKPYEYFDDEAKDRVSACYSTLTYKQLYARQFAWFISSQLHKLAGQLHEQFSTLVISPTKLHARTVATALKDKGFQNAEVVIRAETRISLLDGLKLLLADGKSNLGWRIVCGALMSRDALKDLLEQTHSNSAKALIEIVPIKDRATVRELLAALRRIRDNNTIDGGDLALLKKHGIDLLLVGVERMGAELADTPRQVARPGLRKLPITVTTVQGAKGLDADIVFITYLDDIFFVNKDGMRDQDVCSFLVALTRARKKVFLVSSRKLTPTFVSWMDGSRISAE
jgi:superfamily I DNA/RNA helicase